MTTTRPFKHQWQQVLQYAKNDFYKNKYPASYAEMGEQRGKWNDETANGLTAAIVEYLNYIGGNFTRVNVMGTPRKGASGQLVFTPSTTKKGTADILGCFNGRYIAIEVKIGADRQSVDQKKEQADVIAAGGIYLIARNMTDFLADWTILTKN
jgi:hypothetical protein